MENSSDLLSALSRSLITSDWSIYGNVLAKAPTDENLNETLERVFRNIEESARGSEAEDNFAGLFDDFDVRYKTSTNSNALHSVELYKTSVCKIVCK